MKKWYGVAIGIMLTPVALGQTPKQPLPPELNSLLDKVSKRAAVLNGLQHDFMLQYGLPPQYSLCLHTARMTAQQGDERAQKFLLTQIDFLMASGATPPEIRGVISYGNAIFNSVYSESLSKSMDKLAAGDMPGIISRSASAFTGMKCAETFENKDVQAGLKDLIGAALAKK